MLKPLASAAILVVMYGVITNGQFENPVFPYIYLGNALYIYVGAVMTGVSWAVIDDREHYRTLKYIYVALARLPAYWLGRGWPDFSPASFAVLITLAAGVLFLHVPFHPARVDWPLFLLSLTLGVVMLALMGLVLASISLMIAHHFFLIGEAVAGALYLLSGGHLSAGDPSAVAAAAGIRDAHHLLAGIDPPFPAGGYCAWLPHSLRPQQRSTAGHPGRSLRPLRAGRCRHLSPVRPPGPEKGLIDRTTDY